jgi:hypothetical protein
VVCLSTLYTDWRVAQALSCGHRISVGAPLLRFFARAGTDAAESAGFGFVADLLPSGRALWFQCEGEESDQILPGQSCFNHF